MQHAALKTISYFWILWRGLLHKFCKTCKHLPNFFESTLDSFRCEGYGFLVTVTVQFEGCYKLVLVFENWFLLGGGWLPAHLLYIEMLRYRIRIKVEYKYSQRYIYREIWLTNTPAQLNPLHFIAWPESMRDERLTITITIAI